ncbi:sulfur oxidation c-type cytochrome SoxX [Ancylobacter radicis]|uniref:Sulfur oxidation c-type cytochrome SoxX n=1 Tax=Ancylobacter radicis TaxID=2836179 RepID=A0ABS5R9Z5_9HYPH|nr:sulfur oxidation c-type cytochrome SoxX [Ancylobacter radicis]MBS9478476.1 sulfur oxidation c-type cytochrome SoxX [Ancylobacter radicis]
MTGASAAAALLMGIPGTARADDTPVRPLAPYVVTADAINEPLAGQRGDPARGQVLLSERHRSLCILCHALPSGAAPLQGTLAPSLAGIGARLSEGQIRLRIVDMKRLNPSSIMPAYYSLYSGARTAPAWQDKPVLEAAEIEHLVAYLVTLKE